MSADYKYSAFISYSHKDEKWASWLHKSLETFKVPKYLVGKTTGMGTVPKRMQKVFRDRDELASSSSLGTELTQALTDSACLIVICSPNSAKSRWTNEEVLTYKRLGRENRIFCLIVEGEPGGDHSECFPPALRFRIGADGELTEEPAEPIAADARPQGDGKQNAKIKLIAGMFGVGFDALKQRELQRLRKRKATIATGSVTAMAIIAGLAYSIYLNLTAIPPVELDPVSVLIADFDNQTGDPVFDGSIEETLNIGIEGASFITAFNRSAAQSQIEKLRPGSKLDEEGARLIAVREGVKLVLTGSIVEKDGGYQILANAIDPQSGETVAEADERARDKSGVLLAVTALAGEIREELGDTSFEDDSLRAAETFTAGSLQAAKEYTQAQNLAYLGSYDESLEYYRRAVDNDPQFGRAYSGWALATFNLGRNDEADELWQKALSFMETMTERERYRTLGLYYMAVSKNYSKAIESYESLVQKFPADGAGHNNLAVAYFSVLNFERAMQEGQRVLEIYPNSIFYKQNFALYSMYAGEFELAETLGREIIEQDATRYYAWLPIATAAMSRGELAGAESSYRSMAAIGTSGQSMANLGLADIALYRGQYPAAAELLQSGIAADIAAGNKRATATKYIALAEALSNLGDTEASLQAISEALTAGGELARQVPAALLHLQHGHTDLAADIGSQLGQQLQPQSRAYGDMILGIIDSRAGRHVDALDKLTSAIELSDFWLVRFYRGQAYFAAGADAEALDEFNICYSRRGEASALFLDDLPTWRYLATLPYWQGRAQQKLGMVSAAQLSYEAYLELRPDSDPLADDARQRMMQ